MAFSKNAECDTALPCERVNRLTFRSRISSGAAARINPYWILFLVSCFLWLMLGAIVGPTPSGLDVFIFRDAGWNFAANGSFTSIGLPYVADFQPKLYAHYTPMMPLLFAAYCKVFPRTALAGEMFNSLVGFAAAAMALWLALRQPVKRELRVIACTLVALSPATFITYDRPEALGVVLFAFTVVASWSAKSRTTIVGVLVALTFLAHPFAGVLAAMWAAAIFRMKGADEQRSWRGFFAQFCTLGVSSILAIGTVATVYFLLDRTALLRFAAHAFGMSSGLGVVRSSLKGHHYFSGLAYALGVPSSGGGLVTSWVFFGYVISNLLILYWIVRTRKQRYRREWYVFGTACASMVFAAVFFPTPGMLLYSDLLSSPVAMLAAMERPALFYAEAWLTYNWFMPMAYSSGFARYGSPRRAPPFVSPRAGRTASSLVSQSPIAGLPGARGHICLRSYKPVIHNLVNPYYHYTGRRRTFGQIESVIRCYGDFRGAPEMKKPLPEFLEGDGD